MYNKIIGVLLFLQAFLMKAQTEIKGNLAFLPLGMVNIAVEYPLNDHFTIQDEIFISPWNSFAGKHLQIYMATIEGRYYFTQFIEKWFIGGYFSFAYYDLQKWNYWSERVITNDDGSLQYLEDGSVRKTEIFHKGYSFIFGLNGGYHFKFNEHLGLDLFIGIGNSQGLYKAFFKDNKERADEAKRLNKSGEVIPTRGGLMLTYKL